LGFEWLISKVILVHAEKAVYTEDIIVGMLIKICKEDHENEEN
jgi:hypothetical protein